MNGLTATVIGSGATETVLRAALRQINMVFGVIGDGMPEMQTVAKVKGLAQELKDTKARLAKQVYENMNLKLDRDMLETENEQLRNQLRARIDSYGHS